MLKNTDRKPSKDVDQQDQDSGYRVAAHKFRCAIHGAKKLCFFTDLGASPLGFFLINQACIQVSVYRHLLSWHGIKSEPRGHFGNALCAFGDHYEVDHDQDGEYD